MRGRGPARLVLATPVASGEALQLLRPEADEVVCLQDYLPMGAIGACYADFRQVGDDQVGEILERFARPNPAA